MTYDQALHIARCIGQMRTQEGIDLHTYYMIAKEIKNAIMAKSRVLDDASHLHQFKTLITGESNANMLHIQGSQDQ